MAKEYWTINEVIELFQVEESFISDLEQEEILCPTCPNRQPTKRFSTEEIEKLRLAMVLHEDMGVNLPGVDIILRMRQSMFDMRKQFDTILEDLALVLEKELKKNV